MGVRLGDAVGYHVGMQGKMSFRTRVLFMTTGIFLQRLVNDDDFLKKVTHVILDEVHERDCDIDFAMVILKHLLKKSNVKVILMSATINTELFAHYFSKNSIENIDKEAAYVNQKLEIWNNNYRKGEQIRRAESWGKVYHSESGKDPWEDGSGDEDGNWGYHKESAEEAMPIARQNDPATVINLNRHSFSTKITYLEYVLDGIDKVLKLPRTDQIYD